MKSLLRRSIRAIFLYTLAVILVAQAGMALYAWTLFGRSLTPELERKTEAIALSIGNKLSTALELGIPFEALEGTEEYFAEVLGRNRDIAFIALTSPDGTVVHTAGQAADKVALALRAAKGRAVAVPGKASWADVADDDQPEISQIVSVRLGPGDISPGALHIGAQRDFLDAKVSEIQIDILVVLAISLMIVFESMRFIMATHLLVPLAEFNKQIERIQRGDFSRRITARGYLESIAGILNGYVATINAAASELSRRAGARRSALLSEVNERFVPGTAASSAQLLRPVNQVRLITFLFMFGEQLSRPFLPVFASGLMPGGTAGNTIWAGLPISAFMLTVALSMPLLISWSDKAGRRQSFTAGAVCAAVGLVGAAFCFGIGDFILWRIVTAVGYALMFVACQGFVIDNTTESDRAGGIAAFVGAIMVSELCAPGIGGILSDRLGERAVFAIGAGVMLLAAAIGTTILTGKPALLAASVTPVSGRLRFTAMRNPRFVVLLLAAAIPAKFALTAFMFYIVPVGLASLDISKAEIGRVAMLYAIPSIVAASVFARFADRFGWSGLMVGLGGMIGGAGFLPLLFWPNEMAVVIGVVALGLGQAMSISPQLSLVTQTCSAEIKEGGAGGVLGTYRLVERIGAALGPIVAGALTAQLGPLEAAGVLGMMTFACAVLFSVAFLVLGVRVEDEAYVPVIGEPEVRS